MSLSSARYLLDVNVFLALLSEHHTHHNMVMAWFRTPDLQWAICPFTEAGFLRIATAPRSGQVSMADATMALVQIATEPGYSYLPITADWNTLCSQFFKRLYGTKQVTDAYLLGLAVREGVVLVTMDKGILHLAGEEFRRHVFLLQESRTSPN